MARRHPLIPSLTLRARREAGKGVQGWQGGGLGPQSELTLAGHLENIFTSFLQILGDKTGPEWDGACPRSHSKQ